MNTFFASLKVKTHEWVLKAICCSTSHPYAEAVHTFFTKIQQWHQSQIRSNMKFVSRHNLLGGLHSSTQDTKEQKRYQTLILSSATKEHQTLILFLRRCGLSSSPHIYSTLISCSSIISQSFHSCNRDYGFFAESKTLNPKRKIHRHPWATSSSVREYGSLFKPEGWVCSTRSLPDRSSSFKALKVAESESLQTDFDFEITWSSTGSLKLYSWDLEIDYHGEKEKQG
jgi:hypothetical protein